MTDAKRKRAYTLLEIIVAMAIFLVFVVAVTSLFVKAFESYRFGEKQANLLQSARISMDRISIDLKKASFIMYPDEKVMKDAGSSLIIFQTVDSRDTGIPEHPATNVIGYRLSRENNNVQMLFFGSDFDPDHEDPPGPIYKKTIGRNIASLNFRYDDPENMQLVTVRLCTVSSSEAKTVFSDEDYETADDEDIYTDSEADEFNPDEEGIYLKTKIFIRY